MSIKAWHQEFFAHFPQHVSQEIVDYAANTALLNSRYVFTRRVGKEQYGYCTHCRQEYLTGIGSVYLKPGQDWQCMKCDSLVTVKASGKSRKSLLDEAYFVWYDKSVINPKAIVAMGIYVVRDYRYDYYQTETQFKTVAMYLFEPGKSKVLQRNYWDQSWYERKTIRSEFISSMKNKRCYFALESVVPAVQGTPFQYCTWEKYSDQSYDLVEVFDLAAKYPCVEYLTKLGLQSLVEAKLWGHTRGVVNWRGKTIEKVLKLSKSEIKELRSTPIKVDPSILSCYHYFKKNCIKLTFEEANLLSGITGYYIDDLKKLIKFASLERISKYFLKQLRSEEKHYHDSVSVLLAFRDYLRDCESLGMDLQQDQFLFPNNLYKAHQETIRKVKIKADETLNAKIAKRVRQLAKFKLEHGGIFIRPAASSIELFDEGKALSHCVGRYSEDYANGKTDLFFLRKTSEPDKPFYTMEIQNGSIVQCRGLQNCIPTDEIQKFIDAFKAAKLDKPSSKRKIKIAQQSA